MGISPPQERLQEEFTVDDRRFLFEPAMFATENNSLQRRRELGRLHEIFENPMPEGDAIKEEIDLLIGQIRQSEHTRIPAHVS